MSFQLLLNTSNAAGSFRDGPRVHICHEEAATNDNFRSRQGKRLFRHALTAPDPPGSGTDPQRKCQQRAMKRRRLTYAADPNAFGPWRYESKTKLDPYSAPPQGLGPLHHSPSMYGSPLIITIIPALCWWWNDVPT
ncbi:hypothetical protein Ocin01_12369, partial [Orchesella cincta]